MSGRVSVLQNDLFLSFGSCFAGWFLRGVNSVLEGFTSRELGNHSCGDLDFDSGRGVAASACLTLAGIELTKTDHCILTAPSNSLYDRVGICVKNLSNLCFGQTGFGSNCFDHFSLIHWNSPMRAVCVHVNLCILPLFTFV